ncbi:STAS domain-containing protein [Streptomyces sp. AC563]|uniref:STAS domain-containing protein n=1 Tax=Streptomyces buecherae TaxID=2763006 RepID=UPI00164D7508|nr:STAS domain-containing protein [Streptomyces buecherae]MBC3990406.1 STAS domain-containing protein [Streptomyces buecherae]
MSDAPQYKATSGTDGVEVTVATGSTTITTRTDRGSAVVTVVGDLDVYTAFAFRMRLTALAAAVDGDVVCDLTAVTVFDSTSIGVLVGAFKATCARSQRRRLRVVACGDAVRKSLRVTGLDHVMPVHETLTAALAASASAPTPVKDTSP